MSNELQKIEELEATIELAQQQIEELKKPKKKVVDMSVLIKSGIDCEFSDKKDFRSRWLGLLTDCNGINYHKYSGDSGDLHARYAKYCRPRMNHIHAWQGGECPLSEGVRIEVHTRNRDYTFTTSRPTELIWSHNQREGDIIAFEVLGLADGYCWPYEE